MKWSGSWWGITITAENKADNNTLDLMIKSMKEKPFGTYKYGDMKTSTHAGLKTITLGI